MDLDEGVAKGLVRRTGASHGIGVWNCAASTRGPPRLRANEGRPPDQSARPRSGRSAPPSGNRSVNTVAAATRHRLLGTHRHSSGAQRGAVRQTGRDGLVKERTTALNRPKYPRHTPPAAAVADQEPGGPSWQADQGLGSGGLKLAADNEVVPAGQGTHDRGACSMWRRSATSDTTRTLPARTRIYPGCPDRDHAQAARSGQHAAEAGSAIWTPRPVAARARPCMALWKRQPSSSAGKRSATQPRPKANRYPTPCRLFTDPSRSRGGSAPAIPCRSDRPTQMHPAHGTSGITNGTSR